MAGSTPSPTSACGEVGARRHPQVHLAAARRRRQQHVGRRRCAQQDDGALGRLLERLQERVLGFVGEPVGVLDDHDAPVTDGRPGGGLADEFLGIVDADRQALGGDDDEVGVHPGEHGLAAGAVAAAGVRLALQRRGERQRDDRATRPRRAGDQPALAHAVTRSRLGQLADDVMLTRQPGPDPAARRRQRPPSVMTPPPLRPSSANTARAPRQRPGRARRWPR